MEYNEPYRATRLWNEVITSFQNGMPLKKHRRRMQTHNGCFTASEAVTWLHCYLMNNANFGPDVTRQQTVNLLQKFLKCHVIESVVVRAKHKEFADDSHLYKFTLISSQVSKPSALCLIQSPDFRVQKIRQKRGGKLCDLQKENLPECHFVERKLTAQEIKGVWENVTLARLEKLLPSSILDSLDRTIINGNVIKHNVLRLSKTGVVCLVDKTDDIPNWVISAMKCLVNWPDASGSGSCLPNYPGFEKDVFKVVKDYFINPQVPLLTPAFSVLLTKVFCHFTQQQYYEFHNLKSRPTTTNLDTTTKSRRSTTTTAIKTSTPLGQDSSFTKPTSVKAPPVKDSSQAKLLLDDPEVMWDYPSVVAYETDFGTSNPITRLISSRCNSSHKSESPCAIGSIESMSTISMCSQRSRRSVVLNDDFSKSVSPLKAWKSNLYLQDELKEPLHWHKSPLYSPPSAEGLSSGVKEDHGQSYSANVYLCEINDLDVSNLSDQTLVYVENECGDRRYNRQGLYQSSSAIDVNTSSSHLNQTSALNINQSFIAEKISSEELKTSFQLVLLFLPSANRRQLHLLLRLLSKVLKNGKFVLNVKTSMRFYLLETFLPAILQSDQHPSLVFQMGAFMLDNCETLFQAPHNMRQEVDDTSRVCFGRIRYSVDDTCGLTYCEMVSKQQYEQQRISGSNEALKSLLNSILMDGNVTEKDRKRRLKQFKENHPEVYYAQMPEKHQQGMRTKPTLLNKLANLRM